MGRTMRYTIAPRVKTPVKEWYAPDAAEGSDRVTEYRSVATMESWWAAVVQNASNTGG